MKVVDGKRWMVGGGGGWEKVDGGWRWWIGRGEWWVEWWIKSG